MTKYNLAEYGQTDRAMYDEYVSKFPSMKGKTVAITGTSVNGMGFYIAEAAIRKGADVLICLNRTSGSAKKGVEGLQAIKEDVNSPTEIKTVNCDLQDLENVKKAGAEVNHIAQNGLDVLVCNSGIMATKDIRTKDGFDVQMQTNQLSHFLLTSIVWPSIKLAAEKRGEARVVTHSSSARDTPSSDLKEEFFQKSKPGTLGGDKSSMFMEMTGFSWGPWQRYHQSKLANSCFTMEMHRRLQEKGIANIKVATADPGLATSNLQVTSTQSGLMPQWAARMLAKRGHSAEDGSLSCAMGAFSPKTNSGDMYMPEKVFKGKPVKCICGGISAKKGKEKLTCKAKNQARVWAYCEEALGVQFDL